MTTLREAAQQALASLEEWADAYPHRADDDDLEAINALRAALEEPQSTHSADCYQWHHKCAIAEVERLRAAVEQALGRHVDIAAQAIEWERRAA